MVHDPDNWDEYDNLCDLVPAVDYLLSMITAVWIVGASGGTNNRYDESKGLAHDDMHGFLNEAVGPYLPRRPLPYCPNQ
jgi:hypothetical protein